MFNVESVFPFAVTCFMCFFYSRAVSVDDLSDIYVGKCSCWFATVTCSLMFIAEVFPFVMPCFMFKVEFFLFAMTCFMFNVEVFQCVCVCVCV